MVRLYNACITRISIYSISNTSKRATKRFDENKTFKNVIVYRRWEGKETEYYQFLSQISDQKRAIYPHRSTNPTGLPIIATDSVRRNQKVSRRRK